MRNSLLKIDKKELAFDWIANSISAGAFNCTSIIVKIHTICQNTDKRYDTKKLIKEWSKHIFSTEFHSTFEEWTTDITISPETRFKIDNIFFTYLASYSPLFFLNKKFRVSIFKVYKWTKKDFEDLKNRMLENWFYEQYQNSVENKLEDLKVVENRAKKVLSRINAVSEEHTKFFTNSARIEFLLSLPATESEINEQLPELEHSFQKDLFQQYSREFLNLLPNTFLDLENKFYESGNYLHSFFNWKE